MGDNPQYIESEIFELSYDALRRGDSFSIDTLSAKLPYGMFAIGEELERIAECGHIMLRLNYRFARGPKFQEWVQLMSKPSKTPATVINNTINNLSGTAHFGHGNINISNNDAEALIKLVQELSKSTANKPLGDKIKDFLSSSLGIGSNATTIIQGLAQLGALL